MLQLEQNKRFQVPKIYCHAIHVCKLLLHWGTQNGSRFVFQLKKRRTTTYLLTAGEIRLKKKSSMDRNGIKHRVKIQKASDVNSLSQIKWREIIRILLNKFILQSDIATIFQRGWKGIFFVFIVVRFVYFHLKANKSKKSIKIVSKRFDEQKKEKRIMWISYLANENKHLIYYYCRCIFFLTMSH